MKLRFDTAACLTAAFLLLTVPLNWLLAAFLAAGVHELGHYAAVSLLGGKVRTLNFRAGGAVMEAGPMSAANSVVCSLAGPAAGLLLAFSVFRVLPRTALCALVQSAYNLLPVHPLDGGRALEALLSRTRHYSAIRKLFLLLTAAGLAAAGLALRIPGLILAAAPLLWEKYLAKRGNKGYNSATIELR